MTDTSTVPERAVPDALAARHGQTLSDLAPAILSPEEVGICRTAADVLADAEREAARWTRSARDGFEAERAGARAEGHAEGVADGLARFAAIREETARARAAWEGEAHALALAAVEHFFAAVPRPDLLREAVRRAFDDRAAVGTTVAVNPADADALRASGMTVETDPALGRGEAELRGGDAVVALSLARHLHLLRRALGVPEASDAD